MIPMDFSQDIDIFSSHLAKGAEKAGIALDKPCLSAMTCHAGELMKWNRKINLTAITDPRDMAEKHFLDALCAGQFLGNEKKMVDLGPGAGFPSIPLKILHPSLQFCLVEAVQKKVHFLKQVIRQLNLENITAVHTRMEDIDKTQLVFPQAVITRGVAHLETLIELVSPIVFPQGTLYALKGGQVQEEISPQLTEKYDIHLDKYFLPFTGALRYLVRVRQR